WPEDWAKMAWMSERILDVLIGYGFKPVEPSKIELMETLEAKSGPSIREEIYWFEDKAGRALGLRFDLTVGLARMVAGRPDLPLPAKFCAISDMWRYDEPQFARYRHFWQWDAEIFGSERVEADAEVISAGIDALRAVGIENFEVRISDRKLAEGFLRAIGIRDPVPLREAIRILDKRGKLSRGEFIGELRSLGLGEDRVERVLEFVSIRAPIEEGLGRARGLDLEGGMAEEGLRELEGLADALKGFGIGQEAVLDLSVVRGLDYYDGIVFEAYDRGGEDIGAIFGGGRYDGLCGVYGRDVPGTGLAGGMERMMLSLERSALFPRLRSGPLVFVASANDAVRKEVIRLVQRLRAQGIPAEFDLKGRSLRGQMEYASSSGIPYALIIGPRELEGGVVRLRDLGARSEEELREEDCLRKLSELARSFAR
ncbi:MAG: histidine--tRNA ligase, partial [Candidatus Bathyarchaeia archaeon]